MTRGVPADDIVGRVNAWYDTAARNLPWREPHVTAWGVLVSEFMLQQTQASRVEAKWLAFLERWPDVAALAAASEAEVLRAWDRLGYPRRARWLRNCAIAIVEQHGGVVPRDEAALRALPGVGPYTAAAVASFAYGEPSAVVDTNVRRVLARVHVGAAEAWAPNAHRDEAEYRRLVPEVALGDEPSRVRAVRWNQAAMELGALICTSRSPACEACPVSDACAWRLAGSPSGLQAGPPRRRQAPYAGSDREMRGRILAELREAHGGLDERELRARTADADGDARFVRSLSGLRADGLVEISAGSRPRVALPGELPPSDATG